MIALLFIINLFLNSYAALSDVDNALIPSFNQLQNPGFESSSVKWTASGGTYATTTSSPMIGKAHATWDSNSAAQTLTSTATTVPPGLYSAPAEAFCYVKTPSGTATHTLNVVDGSGNAVGNAVTVVSTTNAAKVSVVPFMAPSSGSWSLRFASVASDEPSISIDGCYLGIATSIGTTAQAEFVGAAYFATTTNCGWTRTNTALGAFGTDTDCPGPTVESQKIGSWQTTDADLPQITINSLPPGLYRLMATFTGGPTGADNASVYAVSDGTSTSGRGNSGTVNNTGSGVTIESYFEYTSSGNRTFAIHGSASGNNVVLYNDLGNRRLYFTIYKFPLTSQTTYATDQSDFGLTSWTPTSSSGLGTPTVTNANDCMYSRAGGLMYLDCKLTTGTVAAAEARLTLPASRQTDATLVPADRIVGFWARENASATTVKRGVIIAPTNSVYLKFSTDDYTGSVSPGTAQNGNAIFANTEVVHIKAWVPISGWSTTNRAPQLINTRVNAQYSGVTTTAIGLLNCDAGSAITAQLGGITSIANISSGSCAVNVTAAAFSATPYCTLGWFNSGGAANNIISISASSSTSITVDCNDPLGTNCTTFDFNLNCEGSK